MSNNPYVNEKKLKIGWGRHKSFPNCRIVAIPESHLEFFEEVFQRVGSNIEWVQPEEPTTEPVELKLNAEDEQFLASLLITTK